MAKNDALSLLREDHREVRSLLQELCASTDRALKKRADLLEEIGEKLRAHTKIEEELFYPAIRAAADSKAPRKQVVEALEEHRAVEHMVLPDLEKTEPGSEEFGGRAKVLEELVGHHVDEEEEELFETARELLSEDGLEDLGVRMQKRKQEILSGAATRAGHR